MMTSVPTSEGGQQQPQEPVASSGPSVRNIVRMIGFLGAGVVLVLLAVTYVWGNSPVGIQNRAHAESLIRVEFGALPPYPGSALIEGPSVTNTRNKPVWITGAYSKTTGTCRSVNAHYADLAPRHGWWVTRPLTAGNDQGTTLSTFFEKTVDSNTLQMIVECRDSDDYYDVAIHTG